MEREPLKIADILKFIIIIVSSVAFLFSVGAKFFHPESDLNSTSTVFLGASSVVLGASSLSSFINKKKDHNNDDR